jgi:signal-transduction protein with cAMP-binding, CBS, and nucleotidyltransferase domain
MPLFRETKIRDAMTERPRAVTPETSAVDAARAMATENVGALPILDDDKLVGIVTDRDLAVRVLADDLDTRTPVGQLASTELVTARPGDDLATAMSLMARHQVRRLVILDEADTVVGMLSMADVALHAGDRQTGEVIEDISEPPSAGPRM